VWLHAAGCVGAEGKEKSIPSLKRKEFEPIFAFIGKERKVKIPKKEENMERKGKKSPSRRGKKGGKPHSLVEKEISTTLPRKPLLKVRETAKKKAAPPCPGRKGKGGEMSSRPSKKVEEIFIFFVRWIEGKNERFKRLTDKKVKKVESIKLLPPPKRKPGKYVEGGGGEGLTPCFAMAKEEPLSPPLFEEKGDLLLSSLWEKPPDEGRKRKEGSDSWSRQKPMKGGEKSLPNRNDGGTNNEHKKKKGGKVTPPSPS